MRVSDKTSGWIYPIKIHNSYSTLHLFNLKWIVSHIDPFTVFAVLDRGAVPINSGKPRCKTKHDSRLTNSVLAVPYKTINLVDTSSHMFRFITRSSLTSMFAFSLVIGLNKLECQQRMEKHKFKLGVFSRRLVYISQNPKGILNVLCLPKNKNVRIRCFLEVLCFGTKIPKSYSLDNVIMRIIVSKIIKIDDFSTD